MSDHYWIDGNGTRRRNCCDSTYDRTHFDDCPRHRERAGMSYPKASCDPGTVALRLANERADRWKQRHDALAARLASVKALHVPDPGYGDVCAGCRDECLYCEGDHVWPCPTIRVLGSDAHTEQRGAGDA